MKKVILTITLLAALLVVFAQTLYINEFMADNDNIIADEQGDFDDWIEIYNPNAEAIDLGGFFLSDSADELDQYEVPTDQPDITTIPAGGFIIVWCDDDDDDGPLHTNFKLSADGEGIYLTEWNAVIITDSYEFGAQTTDISEGRVTDGADEWQFFSLPTPGATNGAENQPPLISGWEQLNLLPAADEEVIVTVAVTDEDLDEVLIKYDAGNGWQESLMYDDGNHNDGDAGDDVFGGSIPGFPQSTYVRYYLEAIDEDEASSYYPVNAPNIVLEYENGWLHPQVLINEYMASNDTTITDPQGDYDDWIEIYNAGSEAVDIGGWYFTDDFDNLTGWFQIPPDSPDSTTIAPGEFILLWADEDSSDGVLHLGFKLSADGESFGCFRYYGTTPVDTAGYNYMLEDVSWGRLPDGSDNWTLFGIGQEHPATPGYTNQPSSTSENLLHKTAFIEAVYPNPFFAANRTQISLQIYAPANEDLKISMYNLKGQKVHSEIYHPRVGSSKINFHLPEDIASGLYMLKIADTNLASARKILLLK